MGISDVNIFGLYDSRDLTGVLLTDYTEEHAIDVIRQFERDYAQITEEYTSLLAGFTDAAQENFGMTVGGELQPYVEAGDTMPTRALDKWTVAYPINRLRDRQMYTEERLVTITVDELGKDVASAATRDHETMLKMLLRSVMLKTNATFVDGIFPGSNLGSLGVKRLCNNDGATGEVYVSGTKVSIGSLQHYFASNTATMTIAAFKTAYGKLKSVGMTKDVVVLISSSDEDTVKGFTEFESKNNVLINDPNKRFAIVQNSRAIGRLEGDGISCEVVVMPFMPAGYFFMFDRGDVKPIRIRQHKLTQFQGFRLIQDETRAAYGQNSLRNKRWERIAGAGVRNRINGVACWIQASTTTYTDPTL